MFGKLQNYFKKKLFNHGIIKLPSVMKHSCSMPFAVVMAKALLEKYHFDQVHYSERYTAKTHNVNTKLGPAQLQQLQLDSLSFLLVLQSCFHKLDREKKTCLELG